MSTRRVAIDDADLRIQYSGSGWFTANGHDSLGTDGPTYMGFQHGIKGNGSFTFTFEGTSIELYGTNGQVPYLGAYDPQWGCRIDGNPVSGRSGSSEAQNNWPLCATDSLSSGTHQLTVDVTGVGDGTFWFDRLMYTPESGFSFSGVVMWVDATDPAFQYDDTWHSANDMVTDVHGGSVSFIFTGNGLTWVGQIPGDSELSPASLTYTIDGSNAQTIPMVGRSSEDAPTETNHIFFSALNIASGSHTIKVTYNGDSNTPLTLGYVYVHDQATFSTSSSSLTSGSGSPGSPGSPHNSLALNSNHSPSSSFASSGSSATSTSALTSSFLMSASSTQSSTQSSSQPVLFSKSTTQQGTPLSGPLASPVSSHLPGPQSPSSGSNTTPSVNHWIIVAGIFGGIALISLVLLSLLICRRRRRQHLPTSNIDVTPFTTTAGTLPTYGDSMMKLNSNPGRATLLRSNESATSFNDPELNQVAHRAGTEDGSILEAPPSYSA